MFIVNDDVYFLTIMGTPKLFHNIFYVVPLLHKIFSQQGTLILYSV